MASSSSNSNGRRRRSKRVLAEEAYHAPHHSHRLSSSSCNSTLTPGREDLHYVGAGYGHVDDVLCQTCGLGDRENQLLLCDGCDRGHHSFCLRPILFRVPSGPWLCPSCSCSPRHRSISDFPLVQTKIVDFFRIQRPFQSVDGGKKRRKTGSICVKKKSRKLLAFVPSKDPSQRLKQMASLATAMTNSGVEYCDELTYIPGLAPRSANNPELEKGGMQVMGKEDKAAYDQCIEMCRQGACPPLMVTFDSHEGYVSY